MNEKPLNDSMIARMERAGDPHRPLFHYLPPNNWMNDPNGLFHWKGKYHLFYQYNPHGAVWGSIHWGHASSEDLVHWQDHPLALKPEPGKGDQNGCWSGCLVDDHGTPAAIYTGFVDPENTPVMVAHAMDSELENWVKSPRNPVIDELPPGVNSTDFRDPYVWWEDPAWKMVIGAGLADGSNGVLLYESPDLVRWHYLGLLFQSNPNSSVRMWECPNFFKLGNHHVLMVSLFPDFRGVYYYVGNYDGIRFIALHEGIFDPGPVFYAPHVRCFEDGRTLLFGWLMENRSDSALEKAGWAGAQSLPQELSLDENLNLVSTPVVEINQLREMVFSQNNIRLSPKQVLKLPVSGSHLEIVLEIHSPKKSLSLDFLVSQDGREVTSIRCDFSRGTASLDTRQSSLSKDAKRIVQDVVLHRDKHSSFKLRVYIDGSVVEAWFDDTQSLSGRVYPSLENSKGVWLRCESSANQINCLQIYRMHPIWPV